MEKLPYEKVLTGFKSYVPCAFSDAVGACGFAAGDVLYDSEVGYLKWDEAVQKLTWSIQVIEGATIPKSDEKSKGANSFLFEKNWNSSVTLRLTRYPSKESEVIVTTQGKLYTALWKGDVQVLTQIESPGVPITVAKTIEFLPKVKANFESQDTTPFVSWTMAYDSTNQVSTDKLERILNCLHSTGQEVTKNIAQASIISPDIAPTVEFIRLAMDSTKVEGFRDAVIEALWPPRTTGGLKKTVRWIFEKDRGTSPSKFSLDDHGIFTPDPRGLNVDKDVWVRCFTHKTFYRYRFARTHARAMKIPKNLQNFLESIFTATPNFLFADGASLCASKIAESATIKLDMLPTHNLMTNAALSEGLDLAKQRHECVQKYLIEKETRTIATEIPVWVESNEFEDYAKVFGSSLPMTGHIDILHMEDDGRIGIWDYKPKSAYETKAFNQLRFYAFMLANRTGLAASAFLCGYFDEKYAFAFKPEEYPLG